MTIIIIIRKNYEHSSFVSQLKVILLLMPLPCQLVTVIAFSDRPVSWKMLGCDSDVVCFGCASLGSCIPIPKILYFSISLKPKANIVTVVFLRNATNV